MTGKEAKEAFLKSYCNYCQTNDWYCSSECDLFKKAKQLTDGQWEDIAKKYTGGTKGKNGSWIDYGDIARSVKRRQIIVGESRWKN